MLQQDFETAMEALNRLRRLGFTLTIDDFGVGYFSLNNLSRFPIDAFKIDRSFIGGVCDDQDAVAIVQAVVGLSHSL